VRRRLLFLCLFTVIAAAGVAAGQAASASPPPVLFAVANVSNALGNKSPVLLLLVPLSGDKLPASSVSVYVPTGYRVDLTLPAGTKVGQAASGGSSAGAQLTVDDPAAYVGDPCAPGTHAAVWTTMLTVGGTLTKVPVFVDPTAGDETARGAYRITFCQNEIFLFELETAITAPAAPGRYTWRAFVSPPALGVPPDPNAVYELRSIVSLPHSLTVKAHYDARTQTLTITGRTTAASVPESNAEVQILLQKGTKILPFATAKTRADGTFTVKKRVVETKAARTLTFLAATELGTSDCTDPPLAPAGCLFQTSSPSSDALFKVRIPRLPPKPGKR
jgi:hypothetical protein